MVSGTVQLPWSMRVSAIVDLRPSVPFNQAKSRDQQRRVYDWFFTMQPIASYINAPSRQAEFAVRFAF